MELRKKDRQKSTLRRAKWMSLAFIGVFSLQYVLQSGLSAVQEFQYVEAGEDHSLEKDDIYNTYVQSAKLQQDLMMKQKRAGHKTWTMKDNQAFQTRRIQSLIKDRLQLTEVNDVAKAMIEGKDSKFAKNIPKKDWDKVLAEVHKIQKPAKDNKDTKYTFNGKEYSDYIYHKHEQGFVEEYFEEERCYSGMINTPGVSLMNSTVMGVYYFFFLFYLFLGIAISADIFMEAIEVITSQTTIVYIQVYDKFTNKTKEIAQEQTVWNATLANLTLMAFGSSAPEIILSTLEALKELGKPAGDLGPSTIVGSAAFNLLVISGVSILAVDDIKKIDDMGVFFTTALFSIFAYVWLFLCLQVQSPGTVTVTEAGWTFGFFFILLIIAVSADKYRQIVKKKEDSAIELERNGCKTVLRAMAKEHGEVAIIAAAQGRREGSLTDNEINMIKEKYMTVFDKKDLKNTSIEQLAKVLEPEHLFERFAARKANQVGSSKEFLAVKGEKFQIENDVNTPGANSNPIVGFKCLHYSVPESAGSVVLSIIKKNQNEDYNFGVRTIEVQNEYGHVAGKGTAQPEREYKPIDRPDIAMVKREGEKTIEVDIIDNEDCQPDLDFYVEIYDINTGKRLEGDDTECKVTILDEDFPGKLGFANTEVQAVKSQETIAICVKRFDGSDGKISCLVRTEPYILDDPNHQENAIENEDYIPIMTRINFDSGESEKIVHINLIDGRVPKNESEKTTNVGINDDEEEVEEEDEELDIKFKLIVEQPEPNHVKVSKKNCCVISILQSGNIDNAREHVNLIAHFVQNKNPTWGDQFRDAAKLQPTVDEDNLIIDQVTLYDAIMHTLTIFWKILFAFIPPREWGGGWPAFIVALTFIGTITAIVAEVATVLGCTVGLKSAVTAITLVAVGTSLPDTFASMTAARQFEFADSAIGNVTGSNSVNVFVGLGLPWLISSIYASKHADTMPNGYETPPGNLAFSVMLFLMTSLTCFLVLGIRRCALGGELGGSGIVKYGSAIFLMSLWVVYVTFSTLKAYEIIEGINIE